MLAEAPKKSRQNASERRRTILDAAVNAFAARGYQATSIREITAAAGITKPVLYDHFPSKQKLYVALLQSVRDELSSGSSEAMRSDEPVEARIRTAIDRLFRYVEQRPAAAKVLFTAPEGDLEVVEAWRRVQTGATASLVALIATERNLLPRAKQRDVQLELYMEGLKKAIHGLAGWWADHPQVSRQTLVNAVMDLAWRGLESQFAKPNADASGG